jgi:hypothetical protein
MTMVRRFLKRSGFVRVLVCLLALGPLAAVVNPPGALAQSADPQWTTPQNLSNSGAATDPTVWVEDETSLNALWQDAYANFVYARYSGGQWGAPQPTNLHQLFGYPASAVAVRDSTTPERVSLAALPVGPNPLLLTGPGRYVYGFWITSEGLLYASRAPAGGVADVATWGGPQLVSSAAASFVAAVDAGGGVHLAYLQTGDTAGNPAGIYYTRSSNDGETWAASLPLYASLYLRGVSQSEANLSLTAAGTPEAPRLYLAWDDRPRKRVLLVTSVNGGVNWDQPRQVAGPVPDSGLAGPFGVRVGAVNDSAVLVWQYGEPNGACTQYFQASGDGGVTWSEASAMAVDLPGCAQSNDFVGGSGAGPEGMLYLLTNMKSQVVLSAWNGSQWSAPQSQPILTGFTDPEIYTPVLLGCHRAAWFEAKLFVTGCGGEKGDIWITHREITAVESWFASLVWSQPALIAAENPNVAALELAVTGDNVVHAFLSQREDAAIYYSRWDGTAWSRLTPVLQVPEGEAGRPIVAVSPKGELFLATRGSQGSLYFSRASSRNAVAASGWSPAERLAVAQDGEIAGADIAWDASGTIHLAYAVSVNDARGIYLVQTTDRGTTWSAARQVLDGAAAGFDLVGAPTLLVAGDGSIHIGWQHLALGLEDVIEPLALHYAHSENGGQSFSAADTVGSGPVAWRALETDGQGNVHRLWQQPDVEATVFDQRSLDGGLTWQVAQRLPTKGGVVAITVDRADRLHLVGAGPDAIDHWVWEAGRWQAEAPLQWSSNPSPANPLDTLAAAVTGDGSLLVAFAEPAGETGAATRRLLFATRTLAMPPIEAESLFTATPRPRPTSTLEAPVPISSMVPTAASTPTLLASPETAVEANDPLAAFLVAAVPVASILLMVVVVAVVRVAWVKSR